jgi:riboflavin kinase/FMN adenylyltransferase
MNAVFDSLSALPKATALAVGAFDGVHLGHQAILAGMRAFANASGREAWMLSFDGSPRGEAPARIYDVALQTQYLLEQGGALIRQSFTPAFTHLSAADFVAQLNGAEIFCGEDWRFGEGAQGDVAFLQTHQLTPHVMPYVLYAGERISSTRIRAALMAGQMDHVRAMLGRSWEFCGTVCHGRGLAGKTFGVPTLNLPYRGRAGERLVPLAKGVYHGVAEVKCADEAPLQSRALVNFGTAPSVKGLDEPLFEVHLLEGAGDFYGCEVTLRIEQPLVRSERKFASLEALHAQILADLALCREGKRV